MGLLQKLYTFPPFQSKIAILVSFSVKNNMMAKNFIGCINMRFVKMTILCRVQFPERSLRVYCQFPERIYWLVS